MEIIEPSVELWENTNSVAHVARCARVCYGKDSGNDKQLYHSLLVNNHHSMFRHDTKYVILEKGHGVQAWEIAIEYLTISGTNKVAGIDITKSENTLFIVVNGQWILEHASDWEYFKEFKVEPEEFAEYEVGFNMMRYTFKVVTQISTSRELNRVSPNNIAERSTRYVTDEGIIVRPHWFINSSKTQNEEVVYLNSCMRAFDNYKILIEQGLKKQDARGVLPLDTMTIAIYTYSIEEWRDIINLRYYGTTGAPHPNAKIIAGMIREQLMKQGYDFR